MVNIEDEDISHLSPIARRKVKFITEHKTLISKDKNEHCVTLTFDGSTCVVDFFGRVLWLT